eukprot:tig00021047_g18165.t1
MLSIQLDPRTSGSERPAVYAVVLFTASIEAGLETDVALTGSLPALGGWDKIAPQKMKRTIEEEDPVPLEPAGDAEVPVIRPARQERALFSRRVAIPVKEGSDRLEFSFRLLARSKLYSDPLWEGEPGERVARIALPRVAEGSAARFDAALPPLRFGEPCAALEAEAVARLRVSPPLWSPPAFSPSPSSSPRSPAPAGVPHGPASCPLFPSRPSPPNKGPSPPLAAKGPSPPPAPGQLRGAVSAPVVVPQLARLRTKQRCNSFPALGAIVEGEEHG